MSQEGVAADLAAPVTETTNLNGVTAPKREFFTKRKKDTNSQEQQQQQHQQQQQQHVLQQPDRRPIKRKPASKNKRGPLAVAIRRLSSGIGSSSSFIHDREEIEKAIVKLREQHVSEIKKIDEALSLRWFLQFQQNIATIMTTTNPLSTTANQKKLGSR
jgi:phosphatidate phosphatase PAH1